MESRLGRPGIKRSLNVGGLTRIKFGAVALLAALFVIALTFWLLRPAGPADLAHGNIAGDKALAASWAKGDTIVLIRHVERCDHSTAACLDSTDGITERARAVAAGIGSQFAQLGLTNADIYNSPLTRTVQTSHYMFNTLGSAQDWLFNCKGTMLRDVLAHKVAGRNLMLVTHSECMAELEKQLKLPTSTPGYGASLFFTVDSANANPKVLGVIEASDWLSVDIK
ncbi:histidine phosphatase family protein [Pseudomonas sp. NPDC087697]|uniref:lipopolysaccharide core heptose(II)-phosphate phosphatase PmrG n=1 Tax=Pseudomonas sp. NPDC087697 TaxID=3364447 RepID=UPI003829D403